MRAYNPPVFSSEPPRADLNRDISGAGEGRPSPLKMLLATTGHGRRRARTCCPSLCGRSVAKVGKGSCHRFPTTVDFFPFNATLIGFTWDCSSSPSITCYFFMLWRQETFHMFNAPFYWSEYCCSPLVLPRPIICHCTLNVSLNLLQGVFPASASWPVWTSDLWHTPDTPHPGHSQKDALSLLLPPVLPPVFSCSRQPFLRLPFPTFGFKCLRQCQNTLSARHRAPPVLIRALFVFPSC